MTSSATSTPARTAARFLTTRWSVVLSARGSGAPSEESAAAALQALCQAYWYPLYAYARRQGHGVADAEDLTQSFFARLLQRDFLGSVDPDKGRFRSFLLTAFQRFLKNEWKRAHAGKRGGFQEVFSLDMDEAERRFLAEPRDLRSPDRLFERRWALTLLDLALARLRAEFVEAGKEDEFERLKPALTAGRGGVDYAALAASTSQSEGTLRVATHRMRRRFREVFREEIAQTVRDPEEMEAEVRHLLGVLSG